MKITRFEQNPLITPNDVKPYHEGYEVIGAFNAGVAKCNGEILLLLRVAERPVSKDNKVFAPVFDNETKQMNLATYDLDDPNYNFEDPRLIRSVERLDGFEHLTSVSYIRIARSSDGIHFTIDEEPFLYPYDEYTEMGCEDARVTQIGEEFVVTYTAVSEKGVGVHAVKTKDFKEKEFLGMVFAPENKDVLVFPEKINGLYYALHRPVLKSLGGLNIWLAESPDLMHWGNHHYLLGTRENQWDEQRIGGGLAPIKTDKGWLIIYHGANHQSRYCMGAALLDLNEPSIVLKRSVEPIMEPDAEYEQKGFFGHVVFGCGAIVEDDLITMYYGVSDTSMAGCTMSISEILEKLGA